MTTSEWYVITAGPSAGKTSTLRELSARGYRTAPESARLVIDQKISEGVDPKNVRSECDFGELVIEADRRIEYNLPADIVLLDRSLADNIAYQRLYGREPSEDLINECRGRYAGVFLLERLPFEDDYARDEDEEEAQAVHEAIEAAYTDLGYDVHEVPLRPVNERADFIEARL